MKNDLQLLEVVSQIIARIKDEPLVPLKPEYTIVGDLGLGSLEVMKMAVELESNLGIVLEEKAEFEINTVGELVILLKKQIAEAKEYSKNV